MDARSAPKAVPLKKGRRLLNSKRQPLEEMTFRALKPTPTRFTSAKL
jgi:hypothetical protein